MRAIEVIVTKNAEAAGRELGHAVAAGDNRRVSAIHAANDAEITRLTGKLGYTEAIKLDTVFDQASIAARLEDR